MVKCKRDLHLEFLVEGSNASSLLFVYILGCYSLFLLIISAEISYKGEAAVLQGGQSFSTLYMKMNVLNSV